ncbi:hypothetical protein CHS0354_040696 [Potamilus streckersoni]|uniref:Uncharacterized protein n=1 Tax=Potamilus streckersoni TaxID=2493646 RepID=A0AAE0SL61_9BIVA|nr:hypothetical protein CHS0354_040696 [Potamilus streckersoni]
MYHVARQKQRDKPPIGKIKIFSASKRRGSYRMVLKRSVGFDKKYTLQHSNIKFNSLKHPFRRPGPGVIAGIEVIVYVDNWMNTSQTHPSISCYNCHNLAVMVLMKEKDV